MDPINHTEIPAEILDTLKDILFDHACDFDMSERESGIRLRAVYQGFVAYFDTDSQCFDLRDIETALKHGYGMDVAPMSNPDALSLWEEELLQDGFSFEVKLLHVFTIEPKPGSETEPATDMEFVAVDKSTGSFWPKHNGLTFSGAIRMGWHGAYARCHKSYRKRFEVVIRPISDNEGKGTDND